MPPNICFKELHVFLHQRTLLFCYWGFYMYITHGFSSHVCSCRPRCPHWKCTPTLIPPFHTHKNHPPWRKIKSQLVKPPWRRSDSSTPNLLCLAGTWPRKRMGWSARCWGATLQEVIEGWVSKWVTEAVMNAVCICMLRDESRVWGSCQHTGALPWRTFLQVVASSTFSP